MTGNDHGHATITLQQRYSAPPERVFSEFADPVKRARWSAPSNDALIYDEAERPVQWLHGFYRPDRYTYEMQLSRVGSIDAKVWVSKDVSAQFN